VEAVTWVIAGILTVDLLIVLGFATVELLARHRVHREIEQLDALWHSPPTHPVQVERSVGSLRVRTTRVVLGSVASRRLGAVSLGTAVVVFAVVAVVGGAPTTTRSLTVAPGSSEASPGGDTAREPAHDAAAGADVHGFAERMFEGANDVPSAPSTTSHHPAPVERFAAVASSSSSIVLVWDEVAAATSYEIERRSEQDGAPSWVLIGTTESGVTTFTDSFLRSATTYYYRVTAVTETGSAPPSDVISATTPVPPPQATSLVVATTSSTTIALDWADVEDETGYRIERSLGDSDWVTIATTGTDITSYTDGQLATKTTYRYRVFAVNEGGESPPSNVGVAETFKVTGAGEPPGQDQDGTSSDNGDGSEEGDSGGLVGTGDGTGSEGGTVSDGGTGSEEGTVMDGGTPSDETPPSDGTAT
jgi:hypothetical protein